MKRHASAATSWWRTSAGAAALIAAACGGSTFESTDDTGSAGGDGGSGASSGGAGATQSGGRSGAGGGPTGGTGGRPSTGGSPGTGGTPSTGGTAGSSGSSGAGGSGTECSTSQDCPQPGAPCSAAYCIEGQCVVEVTDGCGTGGSTGTACTLARDCPPPPPVCNVCPDGTSVCVGVDCVGGQCVLVDHDCPSTSGCPASPPGNGTPCTPPAGVSGASAHCTWGDDPRPECRTTGLCQVDTWSVTPPATSCSVSALPAECPATAPVGQCVGDESPCWYPDGNRCWCSPCVGGSQYPVCQPLDPPLWNCQAPPAGCPALIPQAGSPCAQEGLRCGPSCDLEVVCVQGTWQWRTGACPICAAPNTPIATPDGDHAISELRPGDLVYSVQAGAIVPVPIRKVGSMPVSQHHVVRAVLDTGRVLEISPGHPTGDGRTFADLVAGSALDEGHDVVSARLVPYAYSRTYDILPDSDTGVYFAAGARVGSTLFE